MYPISMFGLEFSQVYGLISSSKIQENRLKNFLNKNAFESDNNQNITLEVREKNRKEIKQKRYKKTKKKLKEDAIED